MNWDTSGEFEGFEFDNDAPSLDKGQTYRVIGDAKDRRFAYAHLFDMSWVERADLRRWILADQDIFVSVDNLEAVLAHLASVGKEFACSPSQLTTR